MAATAVDGAAVNIRPHKIINRSERAALEERVRRAAADWLHRYGTRSSGFEVRIHPQVEARAPDGPETAEWRVCEHGGGMALAIGLHAEWAQGIAALVLPASYAEEVVTADGSLMRSLAEEMVRELGDGILESLCPGKFGHDGRRWRVAKPTEVDATQEPGDSLTALCRCTGQLTFQCRLPMATMLACLAAVQASRPRTPPPSVRLSEALQAKPVVLEVIVGEAELAIGELADVRVGDVLKLQRALSEPFSVRVRGGSPVCGARLGTYEGRATVQLALAQGGGGA
jgi:flagellar motor switch/type III secretory pathway protein FliN